MTYETTRSSLRRAYDATLGDLIGLALAQPHQVLLSTGSVAIMAQFAAHGGIVDPLIGYLIAGGVEWAYLRGLASNAKAPTGWAAVLNWSAFGIVVLWGVLWVASVYGAFSAESLRGTSGAWWLAAFHVVPVAWLSLCAAMTHAASATKEAVHLDEARSRREAWELAQEEEDRKLTRWKEAQRFKAEQRRADATSIVASAKMPAEASGKASVPLTCPACGAALASVGEYGAAKRWGKCKHCKGA